jgi:hypothetical protein
MEIGDSVAWAGQADEVWRDRCALEYRECVGEDRNVKTCARASSLSELEVN